MHIISILDIQTKIKRLDREWRDIQLFKIINGINVSGIENVRMIQQGLIDGKLKTSYFFLTRIWGDITKPPHVIKNNNCNSGQYFLHSPRMLHTQRTIRYSKGCHRHTI
ncbi:hypothetical protein ECZU31_48760 [Escherichia coli]|nr:hypothetical protein ECZU31_48760 [Escherichia coli]